MNKKNVIIIAIIIIFMLGFCVYYKSHHNTSTNNVKTQSYIPYFQPGMGNTGVHVAQLNSKYYNY